MFKDISTTVTSAAESIIESARAEKAADVSTDKSIIGTLGMLASLLAWMRTKAFSSQIWQCELPFDAFD